MQSETKLTVIKIIHTPLPLVFHYHQNKMVAADFTVFKNYLAATMQIENCTTTDIPEIFRLYSIASAYQQSKQTVVVWPQFEQQLVETEVAENRQWKLLMEDEIACVWATTFSDEQIWEERNADAAVYIHRIATNPNFRGNNFVSRIVDWAKQYAKDNGKDFIRLDTLGNNTRLIEYYTRAGFRFLGMFELKNTEGLPGHYHNVPACLFEIKL